MYSLSYISLFFSEKYLKRKLITAAIAIILVVKLIALKLVFVLPLIMGVTTAKKMFLKFLLFLFPALSHIFKLCSWYHQNYHTTKFHHHHHLITHHHKVCLHWFQFTKGKSWFFLLKDQLSCRNCYWRSSFIFSLLVHLFGIH